MRGSFFPSQSNSCHKLTLNATSCFIIFIFFAIAISTSFLTDPSLGFSVDQITYNIHARTHGERLSDLSLIEFAYFFDFNNTFPLFLYHINRLTGDLTLSYKIILFLLSFLYLCSMYLLLKDILNNRAIAVVVSVLSIVPRYCLGTTYWGMGEFQTIRGRLLVMPIFPLVLLLFKHHIASRKVVLPFLFLILGFMFHLSTAFLFMTLIVTYVLFYNIRISREVLFNLIILCLFLYWAKVEILEHHYYKNLILFSLWDFSIETMNLILGFGLILYYILKKNKKYIGILVLFYFSSFFILNSITPLIYKPNTHLISPELLTQNNLQDINRAIHARFGWTLFPISSATVSFILFNGSLVFLLGGYEFFRRYRSQRTELDRLLLWFGISVLSVSLGITAFLQIYSHVANRPYIILETFRASKFAYLFFYVYLGFFIQRHFQKVIKSKRLFHMYILSGLIAFLLIPPKSMLFWMPDKIKTSIRVFAEEHFINEHDISQKQYLAMLLPTRDEIRLAKIKQQNFLSMCEWVRHNTTENSMFLTTDYRFIFHANRDIRLSYQQGSMGTAKSYSSISGFVKWYKMYTDISTAYQRNDSDEIVRLAHLNNASFIVIENHASTELSLPLIYGNQDFKIYKVSRHSKNSLTRKQIRYHR